MLIKRAGFKAFFTGGFPTIGARLGLPDIGLVALGEISSAVTDILTASDLPAMVDGDNGYGDVKNSCMCCTPTSGSASPRSCSRTRSRRSAAAISPART